MDIPKYHELMIPTIKVIDDLGGSGSTKEIVDGVIQFLNLPDEAVALPHHPDYPGQTEIENRLAWARTYLKKFGLIENSERGVWSFTDNYQRGMQLDPEQIVRTVSGLSKNSQKKLIDDAPATVPEKQDWREIMHQTIQNLDPSAFERLSKRLLREVGFVQVEVTGKSGDGGIDGKGIVKIQDVLSYHVVFQCKRYKGSVGPAIIRDFRGAMMGRADKGLIITTGTFTLEATKEATRDGASPIDLIDGDELVEMLKKLRLGVNVQMVEEVEVDKQWFEKI